MKRVRWCAHMITCATALPQDHDPQALPVGKVLIYLYIYIYIYTHAHLSLSIYTYMYTHIHSMLYHSIVY